MREKKDDRAYSGRAAFVKHMERTLQESRGAETFKEALHVIALQSRLIIGAHQSAVSYIPNKDFKAGLHTHSFSQKWEKYNTYNVHPTGEGIWAHVVNENKSFRMTKEELYSHSSFKHFSDLKTDSGMEHPEMPGWLAVPIVKRSGENIGVIQLSDKFEGEFTEDDQMLLGHFSQVASLTFEMHELTDELEQFTQMAIGREERMIELKREVNELSQKLGEPERYDLSDLPPKK